MLALLASQLLSWGASRSNAAELTPYVNMSSNYSSQPFGEGFGANGVFKRISPGLTLTDREGRFTYRVGAEIQYLNYLFLDGDFEGEDYWTGQGQVAAAYAIGPRTTLQVFDVFDRRSSTAFVSQGSADSIETNANEFELSDQLSTRNQLQYQLNHLLTQRLSLSLSGGHAFIDFDEQRRTDSQSFTGSGQLDFRATRRVSLGAGGSFGYQTFDVISPVPGVVPDAFFVSTTSGGMPAFVLDSDGNRLVFNPFSPRLVHSRSWSYNAFLDLNFRIDRTLTLSLQGGPAWVTTERRFQVFRDSELDVIFTPLPGGGFDTTSAGVSSPVLDGAGRDSDQTFTFFGTARLVKRLQRFRASLSYTRQQAAAVGDDRPTTVDRVRVRLDYRADRWSAYLQAAYARRTVIGSQVNDPRFDLERETNNYVVGIAANRRITPQLTINTRGNFRYLDREGETLDGIERPDFENWTFQIGFTYTFAPLHLELPY